MAVIFIAVVCALLGFVFFSFGIGNLLVDHLPVLRKANLTDDEKKRKKRTGWKLIAVGVVVALGGFTFAWFNALPGPSFSEVKEAMESHLQNNEPEAEFNGMGISWSLDHGPEGVDHYTVTLETNAVRTKYLVHFDPVTKEIRTVERKP